MTQAETNSFYLSLSLSLYFCFFQVWGNHGRTDITSVCFIRSYQFSVAFYLYLCLGLFVFFRRLISSAGHNLSTSDAPKIGWNTHTHNQTLVHYFNWIMMIIRWQPDDDNNWPKFSSEITQQFITSETEILVHFRMENDFLEREPTHTHTFVAESPVIKNQINHSRKTHAPEILIRQNDEGGKKHTPVWKRNGFYHVKDEKSETNKWQNVIQRKSMHCQPNGSWCSSNGNTQRRSRREKKCGE